MKSYVIYPMQRNYLIFLQLYDTDDVYYTEVKTS